MRRVAAMRRGAAMRVLSIQLGPSHPPWYSDLRFASNEGEVMSAVSEASELIAAAAVAAGPAVVGLGPGWRGGSGVVVADGRVLTAAHNLRGDRTGVVFADGRRERAQILGVDSDIDLAVLRVDTGGGAPLEAAGEAGGIGAPVVGLARPGGRTLRVTHGFVSTDQREVRGPRGRRIPGIEHTASLPRGSSGGALLDADPRLLGVTVSV